jgi:ribosomal protein L12E/L44/L45/RPP1/RPP2
VASVMLGMPQMGQMPQAGNEPAAKPEGETKKEEKKEEKKEDKMPKPLDLLKGILGR